MKNTIIVLLAVLVWSCGNDNGKPKTYTMAQFMDITTINGGAFSPDEKKIIFNSRETGIFNAVEIDLESGNQRAVTNSQTNAIYSEGFFPEDNRILYSSDNGGNEISHLFVQSPDGTVTDLISDSTAKADFITWSHDRKSLYYTSNSRNKQFFDLYRINISGEAKEGRLYPSAAVYQNDQGLNPEVVSRDDRYVALTQAVTTNDANLYLLDLQTGTTKLITEHTGSIQYQPQYFTPDGRELVYLTDKDSEFTYLASYDLLSGQHRKLEDAPWDISYSQVSRTGKYRIVAINNDARTEMRIYDLTGNQVRLTGIPEGDITGVTFSDSEQKMLFYVSNSRNPSNLFVHDFTSGQTRQLTSTMSKEIDPEDLVEGTVIRYKSYDGLDIPCLLYQPKGITDGEQVPVMLYIHGGPGGQTRLNYSSQIQFLVNHGYAILAVNNRGSSGYGKTFYAADDRKHGDADLKDCVAAKGYLATLPWVDKDKIGIMGGSYGGYMVMAALAFTPEEFKVGVNIFGVTNWLRTLKSIPPWWGAIRSSLFAELGDPTTADSVALYNKSPLFFAGKITKPFIVLQGSNDPRVLQVESDEIFAAAKKNGVTVDYVVFPDEGHGFVKEQNNIEANERILKFLDQYLKGAPVQ
ncbi:MAG: S9 family peptidase [Bacteroidota bacterium]